MIQNSIVRKCDVVFKHVVNRTVYQSLMFNISHCTMVQVNIGYKRSYLFKIGNSKLFSTRYVICMDTIFKSTSFKIENTNKDKIVG